MPRLKLKCCVPSQANNAWANVIARIEEGYVVRPIFEMNISHLSGFKSSKCCSDQGMSLVPVFVIVITDTCGNGNKALASAPGSW